VTFSRSASETPWLGSGHPDDVRQYFQGSADDIYAFGSYFVADGSGHQMTLLLHWDGGSWTIVTSPNPTKGNFLDDLLFAGVVPSPGNIWILGNEDEGSQDVCLMQLEAVAAVAFTTS
jgi:hypothetical protein